MSGRVATHAALLLTLIGGLTACDPHGDERKLTVVGWGGSSQRAHRDAYWTSFVVHTGVPAA